MSLSPELLDILACPQCKGGVDLIDEEGGQAIVCHRCRLSYPVKDNIPVMLIDEAAAYE